MVNKSFKSYDPGLRTYLYSRVGKMPLRRLGDMSSTWSGRGASTVSNCNHSRSGSDGAYTGRMKSESSTMRSSSSKYADLIKEEESHGMKRT